MELSIGDVARRADIQPSAIRYYEHIGILPPARRVSGQRRYDTDVLYLLRAVSIAKQAGFTMSEIRQLFESEHRLEAPSAVWERFARQKLDEVDALIERAHAMKALLEEGLRCGCLGLDECRVLGMRDDARLSEQ
jgi:MerR family transcriptional regulator, redox-sensitive transcriptional activator SoxR